MAWRKYEREYMFPKDIYSRAYVDVFLETSSWTRSQSIIRNDVRDGSEERKKDILTKGGWYLSHHLQGYPYSLTTASMQDCSSRRTTSSG